MAPANYALFGFLGVPTTQTAVTLPFGIGDMCFAPCPFAPSLPGLFTVANSFGADPCGALVPTMGPAPFVVGVTGGIPVPYQFSLQGVAEETPGILAVFNLVICNVQ